MKRLRKPKKLNPNNKLNTRTIARHLNNITYGGVHGINLPPIDKLPPIKNMNRQLLDKINELHDLKNGRR